jgi:hypothetical protein
MGAHRVICGDAADATVVELLMAGEQGRTVLHLAALRQPAGLYEHHH